MSIFIQILFNSLETGSILALATMGIILIFRTSKAFNYAQGAISMFCAFIAAYFMANTGANVFISTIVGVLGAVGVGVIIDRVVIKRMIKLHSVSKQIVTLGLVIVFLGLAPMFFGNIPYTYRRFAQGTHSIFGATITYSAMVNIAIGIAIMVALFFVIQKTKWGLAVRATASNDVVARMMGIPTSIVTMGAWAVAAALGSLAAMMVAPTTTVNFVMMDSIQITALLACVLGGLGTFFGPVFAAYLIALARNLISFYISSVWADAIVYLLILGILLISPNGIFGKKLVKKV
ncbi:MAG: branched-chain amino acid ABC transporter permease [Defluviitaleaceae bacterium]|nr:branched-chain amino acid ABC transporter permease [Defluviitaleaceae bacterium]MCL2273879.1 branched-chain amino acid ABC transporter permease [Defluviitaleaceae bacterium]